MTGVGVSQVVRYLVLLVLVLMRMLLMRAAWVSFLVVVVRAAAWYLQEEQFEIVVGRFLSLAGLALPCADA